MKVTREYIDHLLELKDLIEAYFHGLLDEESPYPTTEEDIPR